MIGLLVSEGKVVEVGVVSRWARSPATTTAGEAAGGTRARAGGGGCPDEARLVVAWALLEADDVVGGHVQRRPLLAVLTLELAGSEAALDEDTVALAELFRGTLGAITEDADAEPVGLLDPLAGLLNSWCSG